MQYTLSQLAKLLNGSFEGNPNLPLDKVAPIEDADTGSISFLHNEKYEHYLYKTGASAVIVKNDLKLKEPVQCSLIRVSDPYRAFSNLLQQLKEKKIKKKPGLEKPSFVHESVELGKDIYIGAFSYIGENVVIGNNTQIFPNTYIGDDTQIGNDCLIHAGVKIYAGTQIGNNCSLHAGSVVGSDGFGLSKNSDGSYQEIPQLGKVVIEDHVTIGANTTIDRATLAETKIAEGVKIDNLVQIAHNVIINKNTAIAAQTGISGSTTVGSNVVLAGQVGIAGHLDIGDGTIITAQSGTTKNLPSNSIHSGSPSFDRSNHAKSYILFRKLPELEDRITELEKNILNSQD